MELAMEGLYGRKIGRRCGDLVEVLLSGCSYLRTQKGWERN